MTETETEKEARTERNRQRGREAERQRGREAGNEKKGSEEETDLTDLGRLGVSLWLRYMSFNTRLHRFFTTTLAILPGQGAGVGGREQSPESGARVGGPRVV